MATKTTAPAIGDLRIWHVCQVGRVKAFHVPVSSVDNAKQLIVALWDYDKFQYDNNVKPDYANMSGLEIYEEDNGLGTPGWCEWCDEETGDSILDVMRADQESEEG